MQISLERLFKYSISFSISKIFPLNFPFLVVISMGQHLVNIARYSDIPFLLGVNQILMICTSTHFCVRVLQRESNILVSNANAQYMKFNQNSRFLNDLKYFGRLVLEDNSGHYFADSLLLFLHDNTVESRYFEHFQGKWL